jgi:hypothetical protein
MVAAVIGALALGFTCVGPADADPIVTSAGKGSAANLQPTVDAFRAQLGPLNPNVAGSAPGGRREINWDGVSDVGPSTVLPFDFFNAKSPRGVLLTSVDGAPGKLLVSSITPGSEGFKDINATYDGLFTPFSAPRLFASQNLPVNGSNPSVDVVFRVPGTGVAATTNAFGAVFADVNSINRTYLQFFSADGRDLGIYPAPTGTLSFVGVRYDAGERIAMVRVRAGDVRLGAGINQSGTQDVVAMDDFVYGEPQQLPTPANVESFEGGLGSFAPAILAGGPADASFAVGGDAHSGSSSAFVPNPPSITDMTLTSPPVAIRGGGASTLTFYHRDSSEPTFDGGIVEISQDNGATWTEPDPAQWLDVGPTQKIATGFDSPIAGKLAFSGQSAGFVRSTLDLTRYAGSTIRYRFRFASDKSQQGRGWFIDDVSVATPAAPVVSLPVTQSQVKSPTAAGRLTALSLTPRTFATGKTAKIGYSLSAAANASFTVARSTPGRIVKGRCTVPAPSSGGRRCTKATTVKRLSANGASGANAVTLALGKVTPGSYTLTGSAGGADKSLTFTVTKAVSKRSGHR